MKKLTVFGVILAIIIFAFYAGEAYDLITMVLNYTDPLNNGLDIAVTRLFAEYPWWWLLCSFGTVICGVLAPILYFCRSVHSIECAFSACGLHVLLFVLNATFRQSWATIFSGRGWLVTILFITLMATFAGYLSSRKEEIYYSNHSGWRFLGSK